MSEQFKTDTKFVQRFYAMMRVREVMWSLLLHLLLHTSVVSQEYTTVTSTRSGTRDDDKAIANCPTGYYLTRCKLTSGSKPDGRKVPDDFSHSCIAQNGGGGNGVIVS